MMQLLRKTYTITVTLIEGSDEFWDGLKDKSGCDEVVEEVRSILREHGFQEPKTNVRLCRFEER